MLINPQFQAIFDGMKSLELEGKHWAFHAGQWILHHRPGKFQIFADADVEAMWLDMAGDSDISDDTIQRLQQSFSGLS